MDETTKNIFQKATTDGLAKVAEWAQGAEGFAREQAPEIAHQIINWGFYSSLMMMVLNLVLLILFAFLALRAFARLRRSVGYMSEPYKLLIIGFSVASGISLINVICYGYTLVQTVVAPKLYLLEQIVKFTK